MIAPLNVIELNSKDVGLEISTVKSLFDALVVIRQHGYGRYIVYSQKTGRRRFYDVTEHGNIVFHDQEEVAIPKRFLSRSKEKIDLTTPETSLTRGVPTRLT